jgi:DNA polymerase-3 subunit delta'
MIDLKTRFTNAIKKNRLAHALLFLGDNQVLKEQTALDLASGLLCESKIIPFGCEICVSCRQVSNKSHPRIRFLLAEPEIRIDQIREMMSTPGNPSWIIPQAYLMNKQASNALLKTLEEPRNNQFFILMAPNTRSLLPTLVSRCQRIFFKSEPESTEATTAPKIPERLSDRLELIERLSKDKSDLNQVLLAWSHNAPADFKAVLLKAQEDLKKHVNAQLILESLLLSRKP